MQGNTPLRVVVLGGGVIGTSVAFRLAERGASVVVVERHAVGGAASGKSGGFLALDWCDGTPLEALARRSFALHADLAERFGGESWGYRRMTTFAGRVGRPAMRPGPAGTPPWVGETVTIDRQLGTARSTAQVDPAAFTAATMRLAEAHGATLRIGRATGLSVRNGRVCGVRLEDEDLPADAVVVAMGPWSVLAAAWLPLPPVYGLKGHSLVFQTGTLPAEALFLEYAESEVSMLSPEVFPRANGTTYVCGISSESAIPVDPARVAPDPGAIDRLRTLCALVSPALAGSPILASQACYRPVTGDGVPLIGAIDGVAGAYVATGHGVWGILNAPATGEAMAELVLDGAARTVDLSPFAPGRCDPLEPERVAIARRLGR